MAQIFLSYSRKDGNEYVAEVQRELEARGYATWRDVRNLHPDRDFTADIEAGIGESSHVVVCVTQDTLRDNSFVRREIQYALAIKKPVIPLRCHDTVPHISIINNEWVDYYKDKAQAVHRLTEILNDPRLQNEPGDQPADPFRPYLEAALQSIVTGLQQRIIRQIDLRSTATPEAVNSPERKTPAKPVDIFQLAMSGVKMGGNDEPEKAEEKTDFDTFAEAFEYYHHRVLLMGVPGAGKTITLMAYAREAYAARLEDPTKPLPLFGLIPTWDSQKQPPLADWIAETYGLDKVAMQQVVEQGHALLLLDGLDELGRERPVDPRKPEGEKYDPRLRFTKVLPHNNQILMTSRISDYKDMVMRGERASLNGAITLQPLNERQMAEYLSDQPELWQLIHLDEQLYEVTRTPLLISLFAFIYQDMTVEKRTQLSSLQHALDLRDQIFLGYIEKRYRHENRKMNAELPFSLDDMIGILGKLAIRNTWRVANVLRIKHFREFLSEEQISDFLILAVRLQILFPINEDSFRFIHLLLRDVLAFTRSVKELNHIDTEIRYDAAYTLGRINDSRAVLPLIKALEDKEGIVRWHAIEALGKIKDSRAIESLTASLKDANPFQRGKVEEALNQIKAAQEAERLISALQDNDNSLSHRQSVAQALNQLGTRWGWQTIAIHVVEPAILALQNEDTTTRCTAAIILGRIGNTQAVASLIAALADKDASVRAVAALALREIDDTKAIQPLISTLRDQNWRVRAAAAIALGAIGHPGTTDPELIDSLWDKDWRVVMTQKKIGDAHAVEPLINALRDQDWHVRAAAAASLGGIGYSNAVEPLIDALWDEKWCVPFSDVEGLLWAKDLQAVEPLLNALEDENSYVRVIAAQGLSWIGDARAIEPLIAALKEEEETVRLIAVISLGRAGDIRAVEPLIAILKDKNDPTRIWVASALAEIGDMRAVKPLIAVLQDIDNDLQEAAAKALDNIGSPIGLRAVRRWREQKTPERWWQFWKRG